ncbi:LpqN/LpqT family lipoprotein [Nocardia brasiliensis]|uniref:LpqN/LpqT family lipoprotein n=1 Tax=Nocardia brasiliensis TaxID=37326 RepID=UPI002455FB45|nr:LpqN/LpqT family lipoprotein [Nocardia brasiliensis]
MNGHWSTPHEQDAGAGLATYLAACGVRYEQLRPGSTGVPTVSIVPPSPWTQVDRGYFRDVYAIWARPPIEGYGWVDNAVLVLIRLTPGADHIELLTHAVFDARRLPGWDEIYVEETRYEGYPSCLIAGTYVVDSLRLRADTRYIVIGDSGCQYLVQFTITSQLSSFFEAAGWASKEFDQFKGWWVTLPR